MESPFELFGAEKKVLASPPQLSGVNVSDTLSGIEKKVSDAIKVLFKYSVYLDRMDDVKYGPAASTKEIMSNVDKIRPILAAILNTESIRAQRKLSIAAALLDISSDYIISRMNDPLRKKAIVKPLQEVVDDLSLIISESANNENLQKFDDLMKRREQRVRRMDRIATLRAYPGQWVALCIFCAQDGYHQDLRQAVSNVNHDPDCIYKDDIDTKTPLKRMLLHYKTIKGKWG